MRFFTSLRCLARSDFGTYNLVTLGTVSKGLPVPAHILRPSKAESVLIKSLDDIKRIRDSCRIARKVLEYAKHLARVGVTTDSIDFAVHNYCIEQDVYPSPLNYNGFPKSVCTSVNNVICHGIPDDRALLDGDILSLDVTIYSQGYHGDCALTVPIGRVDKPGLHLIAAAKACLMAGISACGPGKPLRTIGQAVEFEANMWGVYVLPCVCGHGIGTAFHEEPDIYFFEDSPQTGVMQPGMVFTIEPAVTQGDTEAEILEDGWTVVTADNARSAQFEHTVLITESGVEILT